MSLGIKVKEVEFVGFRDVDRKPLYVNNRVQILKNMKSRYYGNMYEVSENESGIIIRNELGYFVEVTNYKETRWLKINKTNVKNLKKIR